MKPVEHQIGFFSKYWTTPTLAPFEIQNGHPRPLGSVLAAEKASGSCRGGGWGVEKVPRSSGRGRVLGNVDPE